MPSLLNVNYNNEKLTKDYVRGKNVKFKGKFIEI